MTVRHSRFLSLLITASIAGTLALFFVEWAGYSIPQWVDDLRWILLIAGIAAGGVHAILRRMDTNEESFRLGIAVGQHRQIADLPNQDAGMRPRHNRG